MAKVWCNEMSLRACEPDVPVCTVAVRRLRAPATEGPCL
jgi:hypothetical protein